MPPSCCREILPLVCKRFRDVLEEPCGVWEVSFAFLAAPTWLQHPRVHSRRARPRRRAPCTHLLFWLHPPALCPTCACTHLRLSPLPLPTQTLHIDFIQKGLDLAYPALRAAAPDDGGEPGGTNRRLLHSMVERWVKPRAASVKRLVVS